MNNLRLKAWHRGINQMFDVTGFNGTGNQTMIYTAQTNFLLSTADLLLWTGQDDQDGEPIFDGYVVSYLLQEYDKKPVLILGYIDFVNSAFQICYEAELSKGVYEHKTLSNWEGKFAKVLGNKFQHSNLLKPVSVR